MAAHPGIVSLLPREQFEFSPLGRFLIWALSTGRLIVVLTELVVIVAFLSRFWFDRKLADLREARMAQAAAVGSMEETKIKWERWQFLAETINTANEKNLNAAERLTKIQTLMPSGIELASVEISSQSARLTGFTPGSDAFSKLFSRFKAEKSYEKVAVRKLEQSAQRPPGFDFELEIVIGAGSVRSKE